MENDSRQSINLLDIILGGINQVREHPGHSGEEDRHSSWLFGANNLELCGPMLCYEPHVAT